MSITPLPDPPNSNDKDNFDPMADAFLLAMQQFVPEANAEIEHIESLAAAMTLNATNSVSSSSITVGVGFKSFFVQTSKSYVFGMTVRIVHESNRDRWMQGTVTSYNASNGVLTVYVTNTSLTGTYSSWIVFQSPIGLTVTHYQEFTSSGSYIKPNGVQNIYVEAIGGGASGCASVGGANPSGGGGGAFVSKLLLVGDISGSTTVTIGAGGAAIDTTTANNLGNNGGQTLFGAHVIAPGGYYLPGLSTVYGSYSGAGDRPGGHGGYSSGSGGSSSDSDGRRGGDCLMGGAGGGSAISVGVGGVSQHGGDGGDGAVGSSSGGKITAQDGQSPGGGGGAARNSSTDGGSSAKSGAGGNGRVRIWAW